MSNSSSSKKEVDSNFVEVVNLLNARGIPYWMCHGSLLGLVRDGTLIPWDHDIDFAVSGDLVSKKLLIELMLENDYELKHDGHNYDFLIFIKLGGREVDFNFYWASATNALSYSEWFIPTSRFSSILEVLANAKNNTGRYSSYVRKMKFMSPAFNWLIETLKARGLMYKSAGYTTPTKLLEKFTYLDYEGVKVSVPKQYEEVLEFVYGADWKTPKQNYNWIEESPSTRVSSTRF